MYINVQIILIGPLMLFVFVGMEIKLRLHCWGADPGLQPLLHQQVGSSHEGSVLAWTKLFIMLFVETESF